MLIKFFACVFDWQLKSIMNKKKHACTARAELLLLICVRLKTPETTILYGLDTPFAHIKHIACKFTVTSIELM